MNLKALRNYLQKQNENFEDRTRRREDYKISRERANRWTTEKMEAFFQGFNGRTPIMRWVARITSFPLESDVLALADAYFERTGRMALSH